MEIIPLTIMILVYGGIFCLLVYFTIKRNEDKYNEDFEKRDN